MNWGCVMRALLLPLVALLTAGTYLFGIAGVRQHAGAANGDFGSISGVVTAEDSGQPLDGICVDAYGPVSSFDFTDGAGSYAVEDLTAGEYAILFSDCLNDPGVYAEEWYNDRRYVWSADRVSVGDGAYVAGIDAALPRLGSISGVVTNEITGQPLEGICVWSSSYKVTDAGQAVTDSSGRYRILEVEEGMHHVHFYDCGFPDRYSDEYFDNAPESSSADLVPVTWGTETSGIDAALSPVGSISGVVTDDASGAPLEGMCVTASGPAYTIVKTDSSGHFAIDTLDAGDYTVWFGDCANQPPLYVRECYDNKLDWQACDPVHVGPGLSVIGIDAALAKGGAITGTVTNEQTGAFLYPAGVDVYDLSGTVRQGAYNDSYAGRYTIGPLPVGQYKIRFSLTYPGVAPHLAEWYSDMPDFDSASLVDIGPGTVAVIDASLTGINHGDVDCNGAITSVDALKLLRFAAGFYAPYVQGCPGVGGNIWTSLWGDVDCSAKVDAVDALKILRFVSGLPVAQNLPCRRLGEYWGTPPS